MSLLIFKHYDRLQGTEEEKVDVSKPAVLNIPKELWRIVDYLFQNALQEEDLFLYGGGSLFLPVPPTQP